jgi:hypothetical protein
VDADVVGGIGGTLSVALVVTSSVALVVAQPAVGVVVAIPRIPPQLVQPVASNTGSGTGATPANES